MSEHPMMKDRRALHEAISGVVGDAGLVRGWVVLVEIVATDDMSDVLGFCSDATGEGDQTPWGVRGYFDYAREHYSDIFEDAPEDEEDPDE